MKTKILLATVLAIFAASHSPADVLELKNGKTLTGKYAGGTAGTVGFETTEGVQMIETSQIRALSFGNGNAQAPAPASAAPAVATNAAGAAPSTPASSTGGSLSIPAGTPL